MGEAADSGEIEVTIETELLDVDGDGVVDVVSEVTTVVADLDGDGVPDVIESTRVTGADLNGDGSIDEGEISVEAVIAVRTEVPDDGGTPA